MTALRIVTINTGKGDGDYFARIAWMAKELAALDPDVVACQESFVCEEVSADTARTLADVLGMACFFSPARVKPRFFAGGEWESTSGMAILSRRPFELAETLTLPADSRDGERVAQLAVIDVGETALVVANLHLTHLRDADELRRRQLAMILAQPLLRDAGTVRIICGDFNTGADGPVLRQLLRDSDDGSSLCDSWLLGGGCGPRGSLGNLGGEGPCVDYILSVAPDVGSHPTFEAPAVVLNRPQPSSGILPSDHFGISVGVVAE